MTLADLAITVVLLGGLGYLAHRIGISTIPAYLVAGLALGPGELGVIAENEVTHFVAELGVVFLLFFLGLEFGLPRLLGSSRHLGLGGTIDLLVNAGLGLVVGVVAFGFSFAAVLLAAAIYISSSAITVKGLIDFRRAADDETSLVLAILVFEDLVIAFVLGFAATGGATLGGTAVTAGKAGAFIAAALLMSRFLARPLDRALRTLPRELFLLATFGFLVVMAAVADALALSEAVGALMAGVVLAETSVRDVIEERFFSFRDLFAALFFFVFGLAIDLDAIGGVGLLVAFAAVLTVVGKVGGGFVAGRLGGFTRRQSLNVGVALIAHGEFTIILAQIAGRNPALPLEVRDELAAFAGLYVLVTATVGVILMKESKRIGRALFPPSRLPPEASPDAR
jgi:monovalent cation:H+ antiporter-2, CPA2 family